MTWMVPTVKDKTNSNSGVLVVCMPAMSGLHLQLHLLSLHVSSFSSGAACNSLAMHHLGEPPYSAEYTLVDQH